jgi:hypothetical protein
VTVPARMLALVLTATLLAAAGVTLLLVAGQ